MLKIRLLVPIVLLLGLAVAAFPVLAQGGLDPTATPNYGEQALSAGFTPDPFTLDMAAGGAEDASQTDATCTGYVSTSPDFRINWTGTVAQLRIFFLGEDDTTLVINTPSGQWLCNDDAPGTLNPNVDIQNPAAGAYNIWVGTYSGGDPVNGTLTITTDVTMNPAGTIDATLDPWFGDDEISAGFTPDPYTADVVAGGGIDASSMGADCVGYMRGSPTYRITWSGTTANLRIFYAGSDDTSLMIQDPAGNFICNDDSFDSLHPALDFPSPAAGVYNIWVGSYTQEYVFGTLYITETQLTPVDVPAGTFDPEADPNYDSENLMAGFSPDPFTVEMISGGRISAQTTNPDCNGYATRSPDFQINWSGTTANLRVFYAGDGDTTMIVNTPAGEWLCGDDSYDTLHPTVDLANPTPGTYSVWVGSYSFGDYVSGLLYVTETDLTPDQVPSVASLDPTANPNFETTDLSAGFAPDPYTVDMVGGGNVDASGTSESCEGFVTRAPDVRMNWTGSTAALQVSFTSEDDTTLVIGTPSGEFLCNNDSNGTNPAVSIPSPVDGVYNMWVGTFGGYADGTLAISQGTATAPTSGGSGKN
jgi:hypothetical protein